MAEKEVNAAVALFGRVDRDSRQNIFGLKKPFTHSSVLMYPDNDMWEWLNKRNRDTQALMKEQWARNQREFQNMFRDQYQHPQHSSRADPEDVTLYEHLHPTLSQEEADRLVKDVNDAHKGSHLLDQYQHPQHSSRADPEDVTLYEHLHPTLSQEEADRLVKDVNDALSLAKKNKKREELHPGAFVVYIKEQKVCEVESVGEMSNGLYIKDKEPKSDLVCKNDKGKGKAKGKILVTKCDMFRLATQNDIDAANNVDRKMTWLNKETQDNYELSLSKSAPTGRSSQKRKRDELIYKGLTFDKGRIKAQYQIRGQKINVGTFDSQEEAAHAWDDAIRKVHGSGKHVCVNFPKKGEFLARRKHRCTECTNSRV